MEKVIITIGAHNDDYIIGMAGTMAKYIDEGYRVINIICSYGEMGIPHFRGEVTREIRLKESIDADAVLGGKDIIYLQMKEGNFPEEFSKHVGFILKLLEKYKPKRIFTHSSDDPHPDHRAVHRKTAELMDSLTYKAEMYTFDVWNVMNLKKRNLPKLVIDISPYFRKKIKSFKKHKSQGVVILVHLWSLYVKALLNGITYGYRFAEVFYRQK